LKILEAPQYGPMFRFTDASVYWALHVLSDGRRMGRKRLSELVGVGEGSMRRILNTLKERDMITIKQTGITITKIGQDYLEKIPIRVIELNPRSLVLGDYTQAVVVKGGAEKIGNGLQQRDAGIRAGSRGCTTLIVKDGKVLLPPDWSIDDNNPDVAKAILGMKIVENGDAIIIGGADDQNTAVNAALSAAFELV
jgi:hypothetical protein